MFSVFKHFSIWTGAIVLKNLKYNSNLQRETASRVGHVLIELMFVIGWYLTKYNKHFTNPDKKYWIFGCNLIWLLNLNPTSETMWNGLGSSLLNQLLGKRNLFHLLIRHLPAQSSKLTETLERSVKYILS